MPSTNVSIVIKDENRYRAVAAAVAIAAGSYVQPKKDGGKPVEKM